MKDNKLNLNWKSILLIFGLLVLVIFIALYLRLSNLNQLPVFADEAIYIRWAQVMKAEPTLRFLPLSDGKQPLFMWIMIPFLKFITDPVIAGRTVSVFTGIGSLIGVFVLSIILFGEFGKKKWNIKNASMVGIGAATFYAVSPFSVFFDRMALVDSMLSMFGIWTLIGLILVARYIRLDLAMITGFVLGGALLTKSPAIFFIILIPTTIIFSKFPKGRREQLLHLTKLGILWGVIIGIGYAMYNVLRLGPNFGMLSSRSKDYVYPFSHIFESPLDPLKPFLDRSLEWIRMLGPGSILLFALFSIFVNIKKYWRQLGILLVWFTVPVFIESEFAKVLTARYIYLAIPYLFIVVASFSVSFMEDGTLYQKKILRNFVFVAVAIVFLQALKIDNLILTDIEAAPLPRSERSGYLEEWTAGGGIKESATIIRQYHIDHPEEKIVVGTEGYFGTLPDGMQIYLNDLPEITVIGIGLDLTKVPSSLLDSYKAGNTTFLAINSSRLKINEWDFDKYGYEKVLGFQKPDRPDGYREYVQHGPHDTFYLLKLAEAKNDE